jgi:hypothetical protein
VDRVGGLVEDHGRGGVDDHVVTFTVADGRADTAERIGDVLCITR